jgi:hypothetical protein
MTYDRRVSLLTAAAEAFADGRSPFNGEWLAEHKVTLDECYDLSDSVSHAILNWIRLEGDEKAEGAIRACTDDPEMLRVLLQRFRAAQQLKRLSKIR